MALPLIFIDVLRYFSFMEVIADFVLLLGPISVAVVVGVLIGWSWRPNWLPNHSTTKLGFPTFKLQLPCWTSDDTASAVHATLDSLNDFRFDLNLHYFNLICEICEWIEF